MMFPFFTIFILFLAWFTYNRHLIERKDKLREREFWKKEEEANTVRKKDISLLPYIFIPMESLPFQIRPEDSVLNQYENQIQELSQKKILNLTGQSNTDLKLTYGAPNLTFLTECDQNFTELIRIMHQWGARLIELSLTPEAQRVLSTSIGWGSDIKASYVLLARLYQESGNMDGVIRLRELANKLDSIRKNDILNALQEF